MSWHSQAPGLLFHACKTCIIKVLQITAANYHSGCLHWPWKKVVQTELVLVQLEKSMKVAYVMFVQNVKVNFVLKLFTENLII